MNKRDITKGNTYQYALMMNTIKLGAVFAFAAMVLFIWLKIDTTRTLNDQQDWYNRQLEREVNHIIEDISISGVATDSVALNINGETYIYSYSFLPIEEGGEEDYGRTKTYENYNKISSQTAPQTRLVRDAEAYTDSKGYRKIYDYYLVAMGSFYGNIGDIFEVTLDTDRVLLVCKGDTKSDLHTDSTHRYQSTDKSVLEFIVDSDFNRNPTKDFPGGITNIRLVGHYDF